MIVNTVFSHKIVRQTPIIMMNGYVYFTRLIILYEHVILALIKNAHLITTLVLDGISFTGVITD